MSNPTASISNNLGFDVDIYDVYNASGDPKGLYIYTRLGTVAAGAQNVQIQTIHAASQLQAMRTGAIDALNGLYYYQFPVKVMAVSKFKDDNSFSITADDQEGMEQSFKFIKYVTANPDSKTATDFVTALSNSDNQEAAVDTFFSNTGSFKKCTLITWVAVTGWQTQFTNPWQGPYYLYSVVDGAITSTNKPALIATVSIVSNSSNNTATLTMSDSSGQSTALAMAGDGSMQEANIGDTPLSIALTPTWLNIKQATTPISTKYVIGSALTGTVMGTKVTGTQNKLDLPDDTGSTSALQKFQLAQSIINSVFQLIGILVSGGMLFIMFKQYQQGKEQKKNDAENNADKKPPVDKDKLDEEKKAIDDEYKQDLGSNEVKQSVSDEEDEIPLVRNKYNRVDSDKSALEQYKMVEKEEARIEEVLEVNPPSDKLEDTAEKLSDVKDSIMKGDTEDANDKLEQLDTDITNTLQRSGSDLKQFEKNTLEKSQEAVKEQVEQADAVKEAQEAKSQETNNDPDEPVDPDNYEPVETDPIGGL